MKKVLFAGLASCLIGSSFSMDGLQIRGFVSQGFMKSDDYNWLANDSMNGTYEFAEYGLNVSKQIDEKLRVGMQLFARDLGNLGNNEIGIDWAFADYRFQDRSGLKIGKMHTPIGMYNVGRDVDLLRTAILMPQSIYSDDLRDVYSFRGAQLYTELELNEKSSLELSLFAGSPQINNDTPFLYDSYANTASLINAGLAAGVPRIAVSPDQVSAHMEGFWGYTAIWNTGLEGLRLGITDLGGDIHQNTSNPQLNLVGVRNIDLGLNEYRVLSAEYQKDRFTIRHERLSTEFQNLAAPAAAPAESEGNYTQVIYDTQNKWQFSVYKDTTYANSNVKNKVATNSYREDLAFTIRYDVSDSFILKLEYHDIEGTAGLRAGLNPNQSAAGAMNPVGPKDWDMILVKATFVF